MTVQEFGVADEFKDKEPPSSRIVITGFFEAADVVDDKEPSAASVGVNRPSAEKHACIGVSFSG